MRRFALLLCLLVFTPACWVSRNAKLDYAVEPGLQALEPGPDEAVVVFLRPAFTGHAISAVVYEDDAFVSIVMARSHVVHRTTPGQHRYMVVSESADFLDAELEGGTVSFVEVQPRMGAWRARFSLAAFDAPERADDLAEWLAESHAVTPNDLASQWSVESADSVAQRAAENLPRWLEKEDRPQLTPDQALSAWPPGS